MPRIFISYRRDDSAYVAEMIRARLASEFGQGSIFFDVDNIPLGKDFREHIASEVSRCDMLLAIVGDHWLATDKTSTVRRIDSANDSVRIEIQTALARGIPVVPVLVGRAALPHPDSLPVDLQPLTYRNAAEVRSGPHIHAHLDLLAKRLSNAIEANHIDRNRPETTQRSESGPAQTRTPRFRQWSRMALLGIVIATTIVIAVSYYGVTENPCTLPFDQRPVSCLGR